METILLIDPSEEGLLLVVEDAPALGPVPLHASNLKVGVPGDKEEVVIDHLLPHGLIYPCQGEVGAGKINLKISKSLHPKPLILSDPWRKSKSIDRATNSDTGGLNIHVAGVLGAGGDAVVLLDRQCWLSNWTAQAIALLRVNPEVLISFLRSLFQGAPSRTWRQEASLTWYQEI
jgi:hypothetical protein